MSAKRKVGKKIRASHDPRIRITYEVVTPESAEHGDAADRGWIDEEGVSMKPEHGEGTIAKAIKFLRDEGVVEASSTQFHKGIWYSNEADQDYRTGEDTTKSYHLYGFTETEERAIHTELFGRRRARSNPTSSAPLGFNF